MTRSPLLIIAGLAAACAAPIGKQGEIGSTLADKTDISIADVPPAVLAAAKEARADIAFSEAEREVRGGRTYFDIGGLDADGFEIELDIMETDGGWTVVEIQRDIDLAAAPIPVRAALYERKPSFEPLRIIESDQGDGVVIYEFFTRTDAGAEEKAEVKFEDGVAVFLDEEWAH